MTSQSPIRLALIGAGLFARDAHIPAIRELGDTFEIVAIYNHRRSTAQTLADTLGLDVAITDNLDHLLARDDIEAVDVLLPIPHLPDPIERALSAGKHVISEKPIAPDLAAGRRLVAHYAQFPSLVWMVAENWRYEPTFRQAAEQLAAGAIGRVMAADWSMYVDMTPANKYYHTDWRRAGDFQGGFLLDGGVHHMATLRMLFGEVSSVRAVASQRRADLPPTDTLSAGLTFEGGVQASYHISYAAGAPWANEIRVVGEDGAMTLTHGAITLSRASGTETVTETITFPTDTSIQAELAAFAAAIRSGESHRNPPQQALQDLAVLEALLESARSGQPVTPARIVS